MPRTKISEFSATPANNTDIDSINIAEGCAPSGINDAIRELMAQLKDWQSGTSNDPMVIGSSGSLTLNQGTANGVAYLNGSKVVTSGSALTFDGTNLGVANTSGADVTLLTLTSNSGIRQQFNPTNSTGTKYNWRIDVNGLVDQTWSLVPSTAVGGSTFSTPVYQTHGNGTQIWSVGSSEGMRLTSTGLGIGTSSPATKLDVSGAASTNSESRFVAKLADTSSVAQGNGGGLVFRGVYTGSTLVDASGIQAYKENSTDGNYAYGLAFVTRANGGNLTANMRLDGSGNLGLGVTPSAWNSVFRAIDFSTTASLVGSSGGASLFNNAYYNGSDYIYKTTAAATRYLQSSGEHYWYRAASGTAGNAITFTQAMTLSAAGLLGVGVTSPEQRIHLPNNSGIRLGDAGATPKADINYSSSGLEFLDIKVQGTTTGYGNIRFYTGATPDERARIDSSGNLLVGTTSGTQRLKVVNSRDGDYAGYFANSAGSPFGIDIVYPGASPNGTTNRFIDCEDTTTARFQVRSNGGIANYSANNVNLSDRREKTNFAPAKSYLDVICSIPVQTYNYIDQNMEEDAGLTLGVVAQDVQAVAPELVTESNWAKEGDEPKMRLSIYQTDMQYALMKCIQEQQAIIESLKARLDAANL